MAKSYYLRTGIQLEPERFHEELERKYNPYHDEDGKFTSSPGVTQSWGGQAARMSGQPSGRDRPALRVSPRTSSPVNKSLAKERLHAARLVAKGREKSLARTIAISNHPPVRALLHQIARGEGVDDDRARLHGFASSYDVPFNYGRFARQTKPLTQMTLGEVDELQTRVLAHPDNRLDASPMGRYQFVRLTLRDLKTELGLNDNLIFDARLQDMLGSRLLERRGLRDYMDGQISESAFQLELAKEWASIAVPSPVYSSGGA